MALIGNLNFDSKLIDKIGAFFKEFINQPKQLLITMVFAVAASVIYFWYSTISYRENIICLENEVIKINASIEADLDIIEYKENLLLVISELQLLEAKNQQNYNERLDEIDYIIEFIKKHHPDDKKTLNNFLDMKHRMKTNYDIYDQHCNFILQQLGKIIKDSVAINKTYYEY